MTPTATPTGTPTPAPTVVPHAELQHSDATYATPVPGGVVMANATPTFYQHPPNTSTTDKLFHEVGSGSSATSWGWTDNIPTFTFTSYVEVTGSSDPGSGGHSGFRMWGSAFTEPCFSDYQLAAAHALCFDLSNLSSERHFVWPDSGSAFVVATTDATQSLSNKTLLSGSLATTPLTQTFDNDTGTGTTTSKLVKLSGAPSAAVRAGTSDTGGVVGVCSSGCGSSGSAEIATLGMVSCVFDGATTAGDYVGISSSVAGDCADAGSTYPTTGQILGRVLSTHGSGGTYAMQLFGLEIKGSSGGGGGGTLTSINGQTDAAQLLTSANDTNVTATWSQISSNENKLTIGWTGQCSLARGCTAADLSATGGTHYVLKQSSTGAAITVGQLAFSDLSGSASCSQQPALTGVVTTSAGSCATSFGSSTGSGAVMLGTGPSATNVTITQTANGDTGLTLKRATDTSPTGYFFDAQSAAGASQCRLGMTGIFTNCTWNGGTIANAYLANSSITVNGTTCTLGASCSPGATGTVAGVLTKTANYTATSSDCGYLITMNGSSLTLTLPSSAPAATCVFGILNLHSSNLTVSRNGLTINGAASNVTLSHFQYAQVQSDASNYLTSQSTIFSGTTPCADSTHVCQLTFDSQGHVVGATQVAISNGAVDITQTTTTFVGNGSTTSFTLSGTPATNGVAIVDLGGLAIGKGTSTTPTSWDVSGTTLTVGGGSYGAVVKTGVPIHATFYATLPLNATGNATQTIACTGGTDYTLTGGTPLAGAQMLVTRGTQYRYTTSTSPGTHEYTLIGSTTLRMGTACPVTTPTSYIYTSYLY